MAVAKDFSMERFFIVALIVRNLLVLLKLSRRSLIRANRPLLDLLR